MGKTILAIIGAGVVLWNVAKAYDSYVQRKYKAQAYDDLQAAKAAAGTPSA